MDLSTFTSADVRQLKPNGEKNMLSFELRDYLEAKRTGKTMAWMFTEEATNAES